MVSQKIPYFRQINVALKNALIIAFLLFSTISSATDYYISSSGNDSNNGHSFATPKMMEEEYIPIQAQKLLLMINIFLIIHN